MTEKEIDAMEAGREMDEAIHRAFWPEDEILQLPWWDGILRQCRKPKQDDELHRAWFCLPHYSTDIGAAWQVVEKMVELGFPIHIQCFQNPQNKYGVAGYRDLRTDAWIWANTAPLAICRAALKAADCHKI